MIVYSRWISFHCRHEFIRAITEEDSHCIHEFIRTNSSTVETVPTKKPKFHLYINLFVQSIKNNHCRHEFIHANKKGTDVRPFFICQRLSIIDQVLGLDLRLDLISLYPKPYSFWNCNRHQDS